MRRKERWDWRRQGEKKQAGPTLTIWRLRIRRNSSAVKVPLEERGVLASNPAWDISANRMSPHNICLWKPVELHPCEMEDYWSPTCSQTPSTWATVQKAPGHIEKTWINWIQTGEGGVRSALSRDRNTGWHHCSFIEPIPMQLAGTCGCQIWALPLTWLALFTLPWWFPKTRPPHLTHLAQFASRSFSTQGAALMQIFLNYPIYNYI